MKVNNLESSPEHARMNHQGFTLIELLTALSLITILILGTSQLTVHSLFIQRKADYTLMCTETASTKLEYFKSLPYDSEELKEGTGTESCKGEGSQEVFRMEWKIKDISASLKRIEMISFPENCPRIKIQLALLLSRELGF